MCREVRPGEGDEVGGSKRVQAEGLVDDLGGVLSDGQARGDGGVVDQGIDPAEAIQGGVDDLVRRGCAGVRQVDGDGAGFGGGRGEQLDRLFQAIKPAPDQDETVVEPGETDGRGAADA